MTADQVIFLLVVGLRFGVPLLIFRFPLPAILVALVIDAADQTIFQNFTDLDLTGYQGYDKALDIFYLAIAYLSTFRNWSDPVAARVAQGLWYYRLIGVVAFELSEVRALLIIFPNTFEYFFIAYEAVRLLWNPARLNRRQVVSMAAFIWIFIKLPQEWWIHIAQLDFTDFMKEDVFGVEVDSSWGTAISQNLWFLAVVLVLAVVVVLAVRWGLRTAPPPDWKFSLDVDAHPQSTRLGATPAPTEFLSWDLLEKVVLMALIAIIFAQVLPGTEATALQITFAIAVVVVANAGFTQWLSSRGHTWTSILREFAGMTVVNTGIVLAYIVFLRRSDQPVDEGATLFFVLLITLIVTLFDRYRPIRVSGFSHDDTEVRPATADR